MFNLKERSSIRNKVEHERWITAVTVAAAACNQETFTPLKNMYNGKSVVVCGAGPSLKKYIPIDGAIHIALNRALLYEKVKFDYFFADDWEGISFIQQQVIEYDCQKFMGFHFGPSNVRIPEAFRIASGAKKYYTDGYMYSGVANSKLIVDIDRMAIANTYNIGIQIMQVAFFMNPAKIYLAGIDANVSGHFAYDEIDTMDEKKTRISQKRFVDIDSVKDQWKKVIEFRDIYYPDTQVISINPVGLKGMFVDEYPESVASV